MNAAYILWNTMNATNTNTVGTRDGQVHWHYNEDE